MTEKQTHTPGPWEILVAATTRHGYDIQNMDGSKLIAYNLKNKANAHLIAAAPDLLEALKSTLAEAEAYYRTLPDDGPAQDFMMTTVIEPARAAIAKAEGGAK